MAQTYRDLLPSFTLPCQPLAELILSLPSDVPGLSQFVDQVMRFIAMYRKREGSELDIEIALVEALVNAVIHGNAADPNKLVFMTIRCSADGEVSVTIRDQGQGFDCGAAPDPTAAENRMSGHGRGIYLMRALMDEVAFEEGGKVVHLRKRAPAVSRAIQ